MRGALGRLEIHVHWTLPVVAGAALLLATDLGIRYLLALTALFVHEAAHALAALALGGARAAIVLRAYGGVAHVPDFQDRREAAVALAAPLANLAAAVLGACLGARPTWALATAGYADFLCSAHLMLGVGNLLPFRPADGGRALAALRRS